MRTILAIFLLLCVVHCKKEPKNLPPVTTDPSPIGSTSLPEGSSSSDEIAINKAVQEKMDELSGKNLPNNKPPIPPEEILNNQQLFEKNCLSPKFAVTRNIFAIKLGTNDCSKMWNIFLTTDGTGVDNSYRLRINVESTEPIDLEFFSPMVFKDWLEIVKGVIDNLSALEKLPKITRLTIGGAGVIAPGQTIDLSRSNIESIEYNFKGKPTPNFTAIRDALVQAPLLKDYSFSDAEFDSFGLKGLDKSTIKSVSLYNIKGFSTVRDGDILQKTPKLEGLLFYGTPGLQDCTFLQKAPKLGYLIIYTARDLTSIVNCIPSSLYRAQISYFKQPLEALLPLELANATSLVNTNLKYLDIYGYLVDSLQLMSFSSLTSIQYSGGFNNSFKMEPIKNHPSLATIDIFDRYIDRTSCPINGTNQTVVEFCKKIASSKVP